MIALWAYVTAEAAIRRSERRCPVCGHPGRLHIGGSYPGCGAFECECKLSCEMVTERLTDAARQEA